jgi:hypothetical protein
MRLRIISLILIFCFAYEYAYPFATALNFDRIYSLNQVAAKAITSKLKTKSIKIKDISSNSHSAANLLEQCLREAFKSDSINASDSLARELKIDIISDNVVYKKHESAEDSLIRGFDINVIYSIKNSAETPYDYKSYFQDTIARSDVAYLESGEQSFCKAPAPPESKSFFEEIAAPVILLGAAIGSVILLFTVRSK